MKKKKILASDKIREDKNAMQILQKWKMVEISFLSELLFVKIFCGFMGGEKQLFFFFFWKTQWNCLGKNAAMARNLHLRTFLFLVHLYFGRILFFFFLRKILLAKKFTCEKFRFLWAFSLGLSSALLALRLHVFLSCCVPMWPCH